MPAPVSRWVAVFCALTIWALGLFAVSPQLHAALHGDADHQDHACAITLFNHGMDDGTAQMVVVIEPAVRLEEVAPRPESRPMPTPRYWLLPGRAPPAR